MRLRPLRPLAVLALLLLALLLAGAAAPPPPAPRLGLHLSNPDRASLRFAADHGFDHAVVVFSWRDIEPQPGAFFWERTDAAVRDAAFLGLELVVRLDQTPAWAADPAADPAALQAPPASAEDYARFVGLVARRYRGQIPAYILWNEPNLAEEWGNLPPDPARMAALLRAGAAAVRENDPAALVLAPGLAATNQNDARAMDERQFLRALYDAGAADSFDALAAHPYGFASPPDAPARADEGLTFRRLAEQRAIMEAFGDGDKPIWATEFGWTVAPPSDRAWQRVSPEQQARYTVEAVAQAEREWPWLPRMALWWLGPPEDGFALVGSDGPRPIVEATRRPPLAPVRAPRAEVPLLAPDVLVRLGDRGELRPHWFYMHQNQREALRWEARFDLTAGEAATLDQLRLSLMHIDHVQNELWLNGQRLALLPRRASPDPSSHWVTRAFAVRGGLLHAGENVLELRSSARPARHHLPDWRWDNLQIRDARLQRAATLPTTDAGTLRRLPLPALARDEAMFLAPGDAGLLAGFYRPGALALNRDGERWEARSLPAPATPTSGLWHEGAWWVGTSRGTFRSSDGARWAALPGMAAWTHALAPFGGTLWAATVEGLWRWDGARWQPGGVNGPVLSLLANGDGLHAGTADGLFRTRDGGAWERLPDPIPDTPSYIRALHPLPDNQFIADLMATKLWDGGEWRDAPAGPLAAPTTTLLDPIGRGWVATGGGALWHSGDGQHWNEARPGADFQPWLYDLAEWQGALWGASGWGVVRVDPSTGALEPVAARGQPPLVTALHRQGARWWLGTPGGLWRSDEGGATWELALRDEWVFDVNGAGERLWVASRGGFLWSEDGGATFARTEGMQAMGYRIAADAGGAGALGGTWGHNLFRSADGRTFQAVHNGLETLSVLSFWQNPARPGEIVVGTVEGLYRTTDGGSQWQRLDGPRGTVFDLAPTPDGALLAATGEGLWRGDATRERWALVQPDDAFMSVQAHAGWLFAGTEWGTLWMSGDDGLRWTQRATGLGALYTLTPADDDTLWLGGEQGVWVWEPDTRATSGKAAPVGRAKARESR